jgi:hypothetical protein
MQSYSAGVSWPMQLGKKGGALISTLRNLCVSLRRCGLLFLRDHSPQRPRGNAEQTDLRKKISDFGVKGCDEYQR